MKMSAIKEALYDRIKEIMSKWNEDGIYAISFFVDYNLVYEYRGYNNVSCFSISYNTEKDCKRAGLHSEERWNYAYWRQNEEDIIIPCEQNEITDLLFDWYEQNGINDIGCEEDDDCYDENYEYIGKGPKGHYELLNMVADVAKKLKDEGFIKQQFKKELPVIVHSLGYLWYDIEATKRVNVNGEADAFLKFVEGD